MNHETLKQKLSDYACIAYSRQGLVYSSKQRGIGPLVELCELNTSGEELYAADKVIGKAAALLCVKCNVVMLYANVVSDAALEILGQYGIDTQYEKRVPYILNRTGDGKCPMEALSADTQSPDEMLKRAKEFVEKLKKA